MHGNNKIHYIAFKSKGCCCNDHHTDNIQHFEFVLMSCTKYFSARLMTFRSIFQKNLRGKTFSSK